MSNKQIIFLSILSIFVVIGFITIIFSSPTNQSNTNRKPSSSKSRQVKPQPVKPKHNLKGQSDNVEVEILTTECHRHIELTDNLDREKRGSWCLLEVKTTNISKKSRYISINELKLVDDGDREFSGEVWGTTSGNEISLWNQEFNPLISEKFVMIFNIPADTKITGAKWRDGWLSDPVELTYYPYPVWH